VGRGRRARGADQEVLEEGMPKVTKERRVVSPENH
jgi:hypothetical protein